MSATATQSKPTVKLRKFRLLEGFHIGPNPDDPKVDRTYARGDIVESPTDLTFLNVPGFKPKFEKVHEDGVTEPGTFAFDPNKETIEQFAERMRSQMSIGPGQGTSSTASASATVTDLDGMNADQLRKHAEAEEIDVKGAKTKEQLLAVIKAAKR